MSGYDGDKGAITSSDVVIAKPDSHKRTYAFVELENGIRGILGSDPECDKAGAALCVNVGMCHERQDLPGLAHFLEHMLFTGTTKYPKEGDYHEYIQQNGGMANAYTTCYFTNYMFDVKPEVLPDALDRFSRFFTEPLLTKDCTDREINAVDSEFQGGFTQPWWRYVGIMNMSSNPEHPFHVAVGNNKVLKDDPKERGVDLYEEMKKLYESCYSANGMTLCIFGKESIAELEALVREKFGAVVNKGLTMPIGDTVSDKPPFIKSDWNRTLLQMPVKDVKELVFSWVVPYQAPAWKTKPDQYVSHLLGYEGSGSVISVLKQKGLITSCHSGNGGWLEGAFSIVSVTFDLTEKGLECLQEIGEHLFAFIGMLQKTPPEKWIFDEMQKLKNIQFKFGEDLQPFDLCPDIAMSLQTHPPSEALAGGVVLYEYSAEAIQSLLARLTLDSVRVSHQAKCLAERCTDKDTSYDSPMKFEPIEEAWMAAWKKAISPGDGSADAAVKAASDKGLHLPKPNPFIPEDLSLKPFPSGGPPAMPVALTDAGASPIGVVYHRQDDEFKQPKAQVSFTIYTPFVMESIESYICSDLWTRAVYESLNEYAYDAEMAGVHYGLTLRSGAISLSLGGFNDKLGVLLDAVTEKMKTLVEVPENIWDIVANSYEDEVKNQAFRSPPYSQCGMRFNELAAKGTAYPSYKRAEAFKTLKREHLSGIPAKLFAKCHVEALALGNLLPAEAKALAEKLKTSLQLKDGLPALPERAEAALPDGSTVWSLKSTDEDDPNHAVFARIQLRLADDPKKSLETEMLMQLLGKVLGAKFFDVLRTQQQLGYIVQMAPSNGTKFAYLIAVAQSEFEPDYVRSRMDSFFDEHKIFIEEKLDKEEFDTCLSGMLSEYKMKPKNLQEEVGRYSRGMADRTYEFGRRHRAIAFLESGEASLDRLKSFARDEVWVAPRMYNQVTKILEKASKPLPEGASIPEDPSSLRKWTTHTETVEEFHKTAEWLYLNGDVKST